jgi:hypothetical protein
MLFKNYFQMKKLLLLSSLSLITICVHAQQPANSKMPPADRRVNISAIHREFEEKHMSHSAGAEKTTGPPDRWYNYGVYMDRKTSFERSIGAGVEYIYGYALPIWNDTFGIISDPAPAYLNMRSVGGILDPQGPAFNQPYMYPCPPNWKLSYADSYQWDSVTIAGFYDYGSKAAPGLVDTLRLTFLQGIGNYLTSDIFSLSCILPHYGVRPFYFLDVLYDTTNNICKGISGIAAQQMDILLTNADTGYYDKSIAIRNIAGAITPINVLAGNLIACALTFKSGQPGIFTSLPGDTLIGAVAPLTRYNMFRPVVNYYTLTDSSKVTTTIPPPDWPPYDATDFNIGLFKKLNYWPSMDSLYLPTFVWDSAAPAIYQYPEIAYHIICNSCWYDCLEGVPATQSKNMITATPNPADNELTITCTLTQATDVSITLTNMLGQTVARRQLKMITNSSVLLPTALLPAGLYIYTVEINGARSTGKVLVSH